MAPKPPGNQLACGDLAPLLLRSLRRIKEPLSVRSIDIDDDSARIGYSRVKPVERPRWGPIELAQQGSLIPRQGLIPTSITVAPGLIISARPSAATTMPARERRPGSSFVREFAAVLVEWRRLWGE